MFRWLNLLLLLCFVNNSGNNTKHVTGKKGGNIILSCDFEANQISVEFIREGEDLLDCHQKNCRVFQVGSCGVNITDLNYSDAGKYILRVYYNEEHGGRWENMDRTYQLQILDEIYVNKGAPLNLTFLLVHADKLQKKSSEGWKEIPREKLIIHEFTDTDTGTYRVLDSNNETLITVTVTATESSSQSKDKPVTDQVIEANVTVQPTEVNCDLWITISCILIGLLIVIIIVVIIIVVICKCRRRDRLQVPQED